MSASVCPCGITLHEPGVIAFGAEWCERHLERHLETFPAVDDRTREILAEAIAQAATR